MVIIHAQWCQLLNKSTKTFQLTVNVVPLWIQVMSSDNRHKYNTDVSSSNGNSLLVASESGQQQTLEQPENLSVDIEEELARLELETFDDLVYNLGSFERGKSESQAAKPAAVASAPPPDFSSVQIQQQHPGVQLLSVVNPEDERIFNSKQKNTTSGHPHQPQHQHHQDPTLQKDKQAAATATAANHPYKRSFSEDYAERRSLHQSLTDSGISSATTESSLKLFLLEQQFCTFGKLNHEIIGMDKGKIQANGGPAVQPGPSGAHRLPHPEIAIPGTIIDNSILRSDLLAAVEQNKPDKVRRILSSGVDANAVCDEKGRWPLHISAFFGFTNITKILLDHGAQKDQPDTALERTPLLYAAATSPATVQLLLNYRVDITARNKFGANALHYAAGAGQGECCKLLAAVGCDVNSRDRQKMTPLHMASRVDDIWSIEVLLEYGADIHAKDSVGKTALHHAAETCEGMISDYKKMGATFRRLISGGITLNAIDNDGKTALYYAIQTGSPEAVSILYDLGAELQDGVSLLAMGRKFPALIRPFLDKCVSSNIETCDAESKHFYIQFDYTCLTFYPKDILDDKLLTMQNRDETESALQEMGVLHGLTRCKDTSILSHPVCESLLRLKWKKVKWYLYLDMLLFAVFLAFLTAVIFMEYESDSSAALEAGNNITSENGTPSLGVMHHESHRNSYCMDSTRNIIVWTILWVLTACLGIREMIQLIQAPLHYVVQVENMLELVLVFSVAMLSLAECGVQSFVNARDHFAAVCLIVGWTIQVTLYGKIPVFGVYIRMFAAVAVNILKCMFTYLGLLFAFSLTLHFLFRSQKEFDSVGFTFLKTFAMMIGEIELARTFIDKPPDTYIVPFTSHLMFALFIIFISVILMSLLVALAVCDISSMQREGEYMQLVQQVKVASQLEDALQHRSLLYPQFGIRDIRSLHQRKGVIFPNLKDHGKLGKDALEIVITQHLKKIDASAANQISQQMHTDSNNSATANIGVPTKTATELAEDLIGKLKSKMDLYAMDFEKRNDQLFQEFRGSQERGTVHLNREVLLIKSQLEDMNTCLRELSINVKAIAERSLDESTSSPIIDRPARHHRSIDATTGTDFNPTSPDLEATETSTQSSPEPSNRNSRNSRSSRPATHSPSTNQSPPHRHHH